MTTVKLNGKKYYIPSSWQEVTVRQYIRIIKEWDQDKDIADRDYFKLLNIFAGTDFAGYTETVDNTLNLVTILGWVVTEPFSFDEGLPKCLKIGAKTVDIPRDPRELSIGQNIHLRRDYIDKSTFVAENIAIATAIYIQPVYDNSLFDINRAVEISKQIEEMRVSVIYPIGFFLLKRAMKFGQKPEKTLPLIKLNLSTMLSNLWRGWRKSEG